MPTSKITTYIDARNAEYTSIQGGQHNYYSNSLDQILQKLKPVPIDASERSPCLEGTREEIIQSVIAWVSNSSSCERILWLHGLAGSGKSTLATTIANIFLEQERLGAFVFFDRHVDDRSQPSNVIRTIAYQLGSFDARIGAAIAAAIDNIPSIMLSPLHLQFEKLLVAPLLLLPPMESPIILVLDALDECGNNENRRDLLAILATQSIRLPSSVRIIITSRAEFDIMTAFATKPHILVQHLDIASDQNGRDISAFIRTRMAEIQLANTSLSLPPDWPGDLSLHILDQRASGLFVWASTACRFIDGHDPQRRLDILLQGGTTIGAESSLNTLYQTACRSAGRWDDPDFLADFHLTMGTILIAKNPLSDSAIDTLLSLERPSCHIFSRLRCVLSWGDNAPVRLLHPSFADFLSDHRRCGSPLWFINRSHHNQHFAIQCLKYLDATLKRNIGDLKVSLTPANKVLPEATSYASTSWIYHILDITEEAELIADQLEEFLFRHLLHWLEAMSILKKSRTTVASTRCLFDWLRLHLPNRPRLHELVCDASRFVQTFASSIEEHPLLIYQSALPFTPIDTVLYQTFAAHEDLPWVVGGYNRSWPSLLHMLDGFQNHVAYTAWTPDNMQIVSAHDGGKMCVWDAWSGARILTLFAGQEDPITSVAISHDGQQIVSGSADATVRLWDTSSGEEVLPPMRGHTSAVKSVAFCPNGTLIASGSSDQTVRLWKATSGTQVYVLQGHADAVSSVIFSPDGDHILSGSYDTTIRVWDPILGTEALNPYEGHTGPIWSMSVSPDGAWIASTSADHTNRIWATRSGAKRLCLDVSRENNDVTFFPDSRRIATISFDNRIRIWDILTGALLSTSPAHKEICCMALSPFGDQFAIGYHDSTIGVWNVTSNGEDIVPSRRYQPVDGIVTLAFSPDGYRIASSSELDNGIYIWNSNWGVQVHEPLRGHDDAIQCMAFCPYGKLIASGSRDTTIRVWNTTTHIGTAVSLVGHEADVWSVAFSSDGRKIASGSEDSTVRLWDTEDGVLIFALRGHDSRVTSVTFSPEGRRILSTCWGEIQVWDATLGTAILRLRMGQNICREHIFPRSATFSPDGLYIKVAHHAYDMEAGPRGIQIWSSSGARMIQCGNYLHNECSLNDPIIITPDGWIVHVASRTVISKLPSIVAIARYASSNGSATFTTCESDPLLRLFTVHFPPSVLTSPETWDPTMYEVEDEDSSHVDSSDSEEGGSGFTMETEIHIGDEDS